MVLTKKNKLQSTQYLKRYNGQLITVCKQYCFVFVYAGQHKATSPTCKTLEKTPSNAHQQTRLRPL
jgi:hypothetical protein